MKPIKVIKVLALKPMLLQLPSGKVKQIDEGDAMDMMVIEKGTSFYNEQTKIVEVAKQDRYLVGHGEHFMEVNKDDIGVLQ